MRGTADDSGDSVGYAVIGMRESAEGGGSGSGMRGADGGGGSVDLRGGAGGGGNGSGDGGPSRPAGGGNAGYG